MNIDNRRNRMNPVVSLQDQSKGMILDISAMDGVQNQKNVGEQLGNNYTTKVRKAYTITKQREKWTEEEHRKFVEALKLYGRVWRQIEEHIGTKTAIQIRSHAQKFFAKMVRHSTGDGMPSLKSIEIPPPRPKKKPQHPYPRKIVDSSKTGVGSSHHLQETSSSPKCTVGERDQSPSSVLSAACSKIFGSAGSRRKNSRPSPNLCTTDGQFATFLPSEKVKKHLAADSSNDNEQQKESPLTIRMTCDLALDDNPNLDAQHLKDEPATEEPSIIIKLFGKTVMATNPQKLSIPNAEVADLLQSRTIHENIEINRFNPVEASASGDSSSPFFIRVSNKSTGAYQTVLKTEEVLELNSNMEAIPTMLPWCFSHQGLPFPYAQSYSQVAVHDIVDSTVKERQEGEKLQEEGSYSGSNRESFNKLNVGNKISKVVETKNQTISERKIWKEIFAI